VLFRSEEKSKKLD